MILVDTSVWIDHLRKADKELEHLLDRGQVLIHPFVIGEIALGSLQRRADVLGALTVMPAAMVATNSEAMAFIDRHSLSGRGIGYIDVHLLAAASLSAAGLWTRDKRLRTIAEELGLAKLKP